MAKAKVEGSVASGSGVGAAPPRNRLRDEVQEARRKAEQEAVRKAEEDEAKSKELESATPEQEEGISLSEMMESVVVKTKEGLPDMRIKENRQAFLFEPNSRLNGTPDQRKFINRPDLQELRKKRGSDKPNFIFSPTGELR